MGEGFKEWAETYKPLNSLDAIDREIKDHEHRDSGSEHSRQHGTYYRSVDYRETLGLSGREESVRVSYTGFEYVSYNRSTPGPRASRSFNRATIDCNQGRRLKGERQYDRNGGGDKATTDGCGSEMYSETGAATNWKPDREQSSGGLGDDGGWSDTHGGMKDDGSYCPQGPIYFDGNSNSNGYNGYNSHDGYNDHNEYSGYNNHNDHNDHNDYSGSYDNIDHNNYNDHNDYSSYYDNNNHND
ncbi:hypothetical protein F4801DRAFT_319464 [Xylaria longipes]|nr:hypothetical protein F4801DRAFT_319464 [Xylaria longipes]